MMQGFPQALFCSIFLKVWSEEIGTVVDLDSIVFSLVFTGLQG